MLFFLYDECFIDIIKNTKDILTISTKALSKKRIMLMSDQ